jgi:hypothetical protein
MPSSGTQGPIFSGLLFTAGLRRRRIFGLGNSSYQTVIASPIPLRVFVLPVSASGPLSLGGRSAVLARRTFTLFAASQAGRKVWVEVPFQRNLTLAN